MDEANTNEAIRRCRLMDRKAQEVLYKGYFNYAMSIALRYSENREDAVEILNDSFLKVFTKIKQFNKAGSFKAWVRKIIINTSIDKYRVSKRHLGKKLDYISEKEYLSSDEDLIENLIVEDIIKLVQKLPDIYRLTFNLYEIEGLSHKEIGKLLKIDESKSRANLSRAKKKLRGLLNETSDYGKAGKQKD